jgi:hypothetical protein
MSPAAGHQVVTRRDLPRVTMWRDGHLVHDSAQQCTGEPPPLWVDLLSISATAGRDTWRDPVQPGQLTLTASVDVGYKVGLWYVGSTVAIGLHTPKPGGGVAREWLGVWSVQDVRSTPEQVGQRWTITITGTDYLGVAATTPLAAAVTWREWYTGPAWAGAVGTPDEDATKLDQLQTWAQPVGTVGVQYQGSPPDGGDLPEELDHGWAAVRLVAERGQALDRPGGILAWMPVTVDLCQIVAGTMTWQLTTTGNVDTVVATVDPLLGDAYDLRLSTWTPAAGHPEQVWTLDGHWIDPMNALAVAVEALAATSDSGGVWDLAEAEVDLAISGPASVADLIGLQPPWSQVTLRGRVPMIAPNNQSAGLQRTVDRVAHQIRAGEHTVTLALGNPLPVAKPWRYAPAQVVDSMFVPDDATFEGPAAWEHAGRTFAEIAEMGAQL